LNKDHSIDSTPRPFRSLPHRYLRYFCSWLELSRVLDVPRKSRGVPLCDTKFTVAVADPKSVKVNLTAGTGLDIEWKDGHQSHYSFPFLRDACPCALCDEARSKAHQQPGEPPKLAAGALPMFKPAVKAVSADGVGKYAIKFHFNDDHELGIYSWQFLRDWCPCEECKAARTSKANAHL
jgi:DUF971 family protein